MLLAAEMAAASAMLDPAADPAAADPQHWAAEYATAAWAEIVVLPPGISAAEESQARAKCRADCRTGLQLLRAVFGSALGPKHAAAPSWLPEPLWGRMIGVVSQNSFGVRSP